MLSIACTARVTSLVTEDTHRDKETY